MTETTVETRPANAAGQGFRGVLSVDYLSSYLKIGTIAFLILGVILVHPNLNMPALTPFTAGGGPVIPGKLYPFVFITIACGAISGFHALISSGTTPKMIAKESDTRMIGYGSMLMEGVVGIVALIAATSLFPGDYFAINTAQGTEQQKAAYSRMVETHSGEGFNLQPQEIDRLQQESGEKNLRGRTGGAVTLALGIAKIFSGIPGLGGLMKYWYHFAIMFEALFILTIIDAGTRVGRFMLQDLLGHISKPLGRTSWMPGVIGTSAVIVLGWGYFLIQGVLDPLGGINTLWPLFGIANQLLAAVAFSVATTIILKMHGSRFMWVTVVPMIWLVSVTFSAAWQKIWSPLPRIGFLAQADALEAAGVTTPAIQAQIFNARLDAVVCGTFMLLVAIVLADSVRLWIGILGGNRETRVMETPFVQTQLNLQEV